LAHGATEMVKLAQHIIKTKAEDFTPTMLEDHYRNARPRMLGRYVTSMRTVKDALIGVNSKFHCADK
jgi:non-homologous end joining protein Ku